MTRYRLCLSGIRPQSCLALGHRHGRGQGRKDCVLSSVGRQPYLSYVLQLCWLYESNCCPHVLCSYLYIHIDFVFHFYSFQRRTQESRYWPTYELQIIASMSADPSNLHMIRAKSTHSSSDESKCLKYVQEEESLSEESPNFQL